MLIGQVVVGSEPEEMSIGVQIRWEERRESDPGVLRKRDDYHEDDAVQFSAATLMRASSTIIILCAGTCVVSGHSPYSYWQARLLEPGR
jgi:hypothetical protein